MKHIELYELLEKRFPASLRCPWDNDGIMCMPEPDRKVNKILVVLDITEAVVDHAIAEGCDLIISHHPLLFRGVKHMSMTDPVARRTIKLCRAGIAAFSFHTRLDAVGGGVNDILADLLGVKDTEPFGDGIGRVGNLSAPTELCEFAKYLKDTLGAPSVSIADAKRDVLRVAVLGGSGKDEIEAAIESGADTYVSGELGHHALTDAPEMNINLIEAGHFYTEQVVCAALRDMVREADAEIVCDIYNSNRIKSI